MIDGPIAWTLIMETPRQSANQTLAPYFIM